MALRSLNCESVATAFLGSSAKSRGNELSWLCPRHDDQHPSLQINVAKNVWLCGPCGASGTAWQLAAFLAGCDAADKQAVRTCLLHHGISGSERRATRSGDHRKVEVAAYPYTDASGTLLYEKVRYEPKDFAVRRPDGNGGWLWGLGGVSPVLYNLPEVIEATDVLYLEGERDVETARKLGFIATTSGSVSSWRTKFAELLRSRNVFVIADADQPGRKHARRVATDLVRVASTVRLLELPGAKDLTEWVEQGGDRESLSCLFNAADALDDLHVGSLGLVTHVDVEDSDVIGQLEQFLCRYLILPSRTSFPLACWAAATYFYESFDTFPYLSVVSPAKRCGKTRLAEVLGCMALNPTLTTGISEAALFRLVDRGQVTLLLDETEALKDKRNEKSQAIVSILNAGYRRGTFVYRCGPSKQDLQPFSTYCPKVLMAIGSLPDTVFDRSIVIHMRRKNPQETVGRFLSRHARAESQPLREALAALASSRPQEMTAAYETLPAFPELSDRDEEIWQPLLTVCTILCPERLEELKQAAVSLSSGKAESDVDDSLSLHLLADMALLLEDCDDTLPSADLVTQLKELPESPWNEPGHELTANRLARMLRPFGVRPRTIRVGSNKTPKGYLKADLMEVISLYVRLEPQQPPQTNSDRGLEAYFRPQQRDSVAASKSE